MAPVRIKDRFVLKVAVIGAGITGVSAAWHLDQGGMQACVLVVNHIRTCYLFRRVVSPSIPASLSQTLLVIQAFTIG